MDVSFLFPPATGNRARFLPHLGTAYLQAALAARGIESRQFRSRQPAHAAEVAREVLDAAPAIVGFTVYDSNLGVALNIARHIKAKRPSTWILLGGPTSTFSYRRVLLNHGVVDLCAIGEMERIGPQIIEDLLGARPGRLPESIRSSPGVAFRNGDDVSATGFAPLAGSRSDSQHPLDELASPYLSGILTDGQAGVLSGRGCNQNCVYCCFAAIGRRRIRFHSLERVMAELEVIAHAAKKSGELRVVTFHDDTFTLFPQRAKLLCEQLAKRQLGLRFSCITRADKVDEELLCLMKDAGFVAVAFGLESAVPAVLRKIGKVKPPDSKLTSLDPEREFVERLRKSVVRAKELGMLVGVSIILGLPGEERQHAEDTLAFIRQLPADYYMHNLLQVFEGTPLWNNSEADGIHVADGPLGLPAVSQYAYDARAVRPAANCSLLREASYALSIASHGLHGCSALGSEGRPLSLVVLHSNSLTETMAHWLAEVLPLGGIVLQVYDGADAVPLNRQLAQDQFRFADTQIPARLYLQLAKEEEKSDGTVHWRVRSAVGSIAEARSSDLVRFRTTRSHQPLVEWASTGRSPCEVCDAGDLLADKEFLEGLSAWLRADGLAERLDRCDPPPAMIYPGRYLEPPAPCSNMSRIEIDDEGTVRLCAQGPVVGKVGDTPSELCAAARAALSGCAPSGGNNMRCPLMKAGDEVDSVVYWLQLLSRLPLHVYDMIDESQQH